MSVQIVQELVDPRCNTISTHKAQFIQICYTLPSLIHNPEKRYAKEQFTLKKTPSPVQIKTHPSINRIPIYVFSIIGNAVPLYNFEYISPNLQDEFLISTTGPFHDNFPSPSTPYQLRQIDFGRGSLIAVQGLKGIGHMQPMNIVCTYELLYHNQRIVDRIYIAIYHWISNVQYSAWSGGNYELLGLGEVRCTSGWDKYI